MSGPFFLGGGEYLIKVGPIFWYKFAEFSSKN